MNAAALNEICFAAAKYCTTANWCDATMTP